jgi:L-fuconate dehydratase
VIDYLSVSTSLEDRTTEYASHLHEHFVNPIQMRNGHYLLPQAPGYSIEMKQESIDMLNYPNGAEWRD